MLANFDSWFEFVNRRWRFGRAYSDIILITDCVKAVDWASTVFANNTTKGAKFAVNVGPDSIVSGQVHLNATWQTISGAQSRSGPKRAVGAPIVYDQLLFLECFKLRKRIFRVPVVMKAAAEPQDPKYDPSDRRGGADAPGVSSNEESYEVVRGSSTGPVSTVGKRFSSKLNSHVQGYDPCEPIFDHIFEVH